MNKPWKLILLLVGIFLAGAVSGTMLAIHLGREWLPGRAGPDQWDVLHLKKLSERLQLRPEQVEVIKPIVRRDMEELRRVRNQSMTDTRAIFDRMQHDIAEKLTPEQRKQFDDFNRERRERVQKFLQRKPDQPRGPEGERRPKPDKKGE